MRFYLFTLLFLSLLFKSNAQNDTGSTGPLLIHTACIKPDESNWSARKNILNAESYRDLQIRSSCDIDSFPSVDFNKYILLLISYSYSGCEKNVNRKITYSIDHHNKKLVILLFISQKGPCRPMYYANDFFRIPIIPKSYSIEIYKPQITAPTIIPAE